MSQRKVGCGQVRKPALKLSRCCKPAVSPKHSEYAPCVQEADHGVISGLISLAVTE